VWVSSCPGYLACFSGWEKGLSDVRVGDLDVGAVYQKFKMKFKTLARA
jgi:hypothetical protein